MSDRVEELEKRVRQLEEEVAALKRLLAELPPGMPPKGPSGRDWLPHEIRSMREHAAGLAAFDAFLAARGIKGEPIGAEKLQELILSDGTCDPTQNLASRGIIEAREE